MVGEAGSGQANRRKSKPVRYFYLNGKLHKKLHINRPADEITAWCYPDHVRVTYPYQMTRRRMQPAFSTAEVQKLLNRGRLALERAMLRGDIEYPQHTYTLDEKRRKFKYMWSEDDIIAAHAYFSTVHRGRPRKDGLVTPQALPTVRELRAMIHDREILYVKDGDKFRPTWEAPDF